MTKKEAEESSISSIGEFIAWTEELAENGDNYIFRGQADAAWQLCSGAARRLCVTNNDTNNIIEYAEDLIKRTRDRGLHHCQHELKELEILAELQHQGAATPLLDFSRNAMVALWMACSNSKERGKDGRIYAIDYSEQKKFHKITEEELTKGIGELLNDEKSWIWEVGRQNERIMAQGSFFLIAREPYQNLKEISIIVDRNSKTKILQYLSKVIGLTEENIYPDLSGFALANAAEKPTKFANQSEVLPFAIELYWEKEYEKALPYFDRVIQQKPSAEAYFFSAHTKEKLGDKAGAETDYTQSIELNPTAEAYNNRGNLRYVLKRYQEAEADFNDAIKLKPALAEAYSNRGNAIKALRIVSRYQEAEANFNEAIKLKPNFARAYNNRGNLYLIWNRKNEAKQDYEQALKLAQQQNNQKEIEISQDNLDKFTSHSGSQK